MMTNKAVSQDLVYFSLNLAGEKMELETERLRIVALKPAQLALWVDDLSRLENELQCSYQAEPMTGMFKKIVQGQLNSTQNHQAQYLWHSFWFIIRKTDRVVVGSADFKDVPNTQGEVEIGYGLGRAFEHNGYMTEAVSAMCDWACRQDGVQHIIAETEVDGLASQRILQRCGFIEYARNDTVWWRREAKKSS